MPNEFEFDYSDMQAKFNEWQEKAEKGLLAYAKTSAIDMAAKMRETAPWQNRTGHARQRLNGEGSKVEKGYQIALSHGVDYGVYLEYAHMKRFAIIQPTINSMGVNEVLPNWQKLVFNLKFSG